MKYKFFGQPGMLVKTRKKVLFENKIVHKPLFRFDDKGEYITEDMELIDRLKSKFDHVIFDETVIEQPKLEPIIEKEPEVIAFICKKCGEGFESKGKFLAHTRKCGKDD